MDDDQLWAAIDDQRRRTADLLDSLTDEQWDHPSLCAGWTVRHVAAHLTLQQQRLRDIAVFTLHNPRLLRSGTLNRVIHDTAVMQARLPRAEITGRIRAMVGSRRHNSFVTPRETLTDILVHGQDIAVPLGRHLDMLPHAAAEAAGRIWDTRGSWMARVFDTLPLEGYRLSATDVEWTVGDGSEVAGPVRALLLLLTGRPVALGELVGPGAEELRRQRQAA
ncbi:hypothetical protein N864_20930 [Intrasporangium chromatireducens Q5-1]|uniref:Mycothiol-dependent maleylpyruvate isomerase metal-binding domain-containing protein n=1 Tax=Intrasporangium chromatireducens Q5-1 TaxID=584657 RepID=W9GNX8_9MICO|nr:maleylpyruvate isomerase family mycothiol-dependent enzyme [Intrasporangium chromatireducens]EWT06498.1 hypothetical protein N864_20930 [Intrasporangium chromatireducens Q5-1]